MAKQFYAYSLAGLSVGFLIFGGVNFPRFFTSERGIDFNDSFGSRQESLKITQIGQPVYSATATLSAGSHARFRRDNDTLVLDVISANLDPLAFDGAGEVQITLKANGYTSRHTLRISPRMSSTQTYSKAYDKVKAGPFTVSLTNYTQSFDVPVFTFEIN